MCSRVAGVFITLACGVLAAAAPAGGQQAAGADPALDSLLNTRISSASKYSQTSAEAPASVTIVTSDEIRAHGYTDLEELLESVRGMYVTNDHNYPYLGTRGFSRPTDYNNRILVLVDGHTINEKIWGGAGTGSDFPLNLDAVERVEIVRGPGSALYGTSAMFAVINIVTKSGSELDGVRVAARYGTGRMREASMAGGRALGSFASIAVSGLVFRSDGVDRTYPELDSPRGAGVARGVDWEDGFSSMASVALRNVTARVGYTTRSKGIPTGSFGTLFNDPRAETVEAKLWSELAVRQGFGETRQMSARVFADRYRYTGSYPYDASFDYTDGGKGTSVGAETMFIWDPSSRNRLTVGAEYLAVIQAEFYDRDNTVFTQDDAPFNVASLFAQNELQLGSMITVVGGLRLDSRSRLGSAWSPRLAVVATPDASTTVKLLYGDAHRAPSPSEGEISSSIYSPNPSLTSERIRTLELEVHRRMGNALLLTASGYSYRIRGLIDQVPQSDGTIQFGNIASATGRGLELQADLMPDAPFSVRGWYSLQRSQDATTKEVLTNAPRSVAHLAGIARFGGGLHSAVSIRHESGRRTTIGDFTGSFARVDANLGFDGTTGGKLSWMNGVAVGLRVKNIFDARYSHPGGLDNPQTQIPQDRRSFSLRFSRAF